MQIVTTKAMAKIAAVATGLAMATSMLSLAPIAHAAALTSSQVQSILSLLSSFGADSNTIANVQASLTGGTPSSTTSGSSTTTTGSSSYTFTRDLTVGSTGADVTALQNALITKGDLSVSATGYFGALTKAAVIKWQISAGVTPTAGYFGAKSRAAFGGASSSSSSTTTTTTTTTTGTTPITGNGLKVALAATSPNGSVLVMKQAIGDLADFTFSNPTSAPIAVTGLTFKRIGVSNDSTMTNVYLYNAGTRITDSAGVSSSQFSFSAASTGIFTVPANGTYTVSVRSDIADTTSGQQIGVQLVSVTSSGTLDSSVSFPINSGYQTISAATLAAVSFGQTTTPLATSISPQNDFPIWQNTISVSTNPVKVSAMKFTNLGSIDSSYVINLRLYVDGVQVGSAVPVMGSDRTVTFDLTSAPMLLSTQSHVVKVLANITGGASRTIVMSIQRSADAMFVDSQLGQPVAPVTSTNTPFTAMSSGIITINSVTASSGVSVSLAPNSPNQTVAVGSSNVKWASFNMLASGENVKVSDLFVTASTSVNGVISGAGGLKNGKVYFNGVQVGSTKDISAVGTTGTIGAGTDFALGSSLILPAGQTAVVDIYGDAKDTNSTNILPNGTVVVTLVMGSSNAQGMSSLSSTSVPAANTPGNAITVSSSTLTATKFTGYGSQTVIPGTNNAKIGAFTLSTGSTEGVTVNTIAVQLQTGNSASLTNLTLKDDATGSTIGSVITTPNDTNNSFSVNYDIPASSTRTVDIYANVLSGAGAGNIIATITTSTTGTGDTTGISASAVSTTLQTVAIGTGSLAFTRGAGDPTSTTVVAGSSSVSVGQFNFAATNSSYTVQNVAVLIPNNLATSVTNVTVSYKDVNGATQTATQALAVTPTSANAIAQFTNLTMYVPANDSANLNVSVGIPTIASGATSGAAINVSIGGGGTNGSDGTFKAVNAAGTALTNVNSIGSGSTGTKLSSNGTFYVYKSVPTFAMQTVTSAVPTTGNALYRFSISADPAGAIEWAHLMFNVATSSTSGNPMLTNVYLVDEAAPSNNLLDNTSTSASTTQTTITIDLTKNSTQPQFNQIAAGATKTYDLYGTVANFTTGSTLTISLASDSVAVPPVGEALVNKNTIWSDRSAAGHSLTTADWTGGYLIKNFTSNATSYSK
jgi:hypothetical protein